MVSLGHVFVGWGKHWRILPTSEAERKLSELRLTICAKCPFHRMHQVLEFLEGDEAEYVDKIYCTKCHCPCAAKTIVVGERCPKGKW